MSRRRNLAETAKMAECDNLNCCWTIEVEIYKHSYPDESANQLNQKEQKASGYVNVVKDQLLISRMNIHVAWQSMSIISIT